MNFRQYFSKWSFWTQNQRGYPLPKFDFRPIFHFGMVWGGKCDFGMNLQWIVQCFDEEWRFYLQKYEEFLRKKLAHNPHDSQKFQNGHEKNILTRIPYKTNLAHKFYATHSEISERFPEISKRPRTKIFFPESLIKLTWPKNFTPHSKISKQFQNGLEKKYSSQNPL